MSTFLQLTGAVAVACCFSAGLSAQVLNPTITGDNMLCPEGTGTVSTGEFESYQWYYRPYGTTDTLLISGATSQDLVIDYYTYAPSYLIVEVTDNGTTEMSPEFFVDGWAFLGPVVSTTGDFTIGQNGESILCEGDTLWFEILSPNTTNVTWFDGGDTIVGQTNPVLEVTEAGSYTVSGAPAECPDFVQYMGIPLDVMVENCGAAGIGEDNLPEAKIYPNPATDQLTIEHPFERIAKIEIRNAAGQLVRIVTVNGLSVTVGVENLRAGTYFVTVHYADSSEVRPFAVK